MSGSACPDDELLAEFVERTLAESTRAEIEAHVLRCQSCGDALAQLAATFADDDGEQESAVPPVHERGSQLGRYLVIGTLGRGAMGVVYSAYDPDLDRKVAVKVLRPVEGDAAEDQPERARRLIREARVLASISHPNVITIHDVGVVDDQVFVAMELIQGRTLDRWLRAEPRPVAEILEVSIAAGRGLCAAHAAGVVHRDFKPENVLVRDDPPERRSVGSRTVDRVLVTDFGLARVDLRAPTHERTIDADAGAVASVATHTAAGALIGTPAYMAPEQLRRERADARADQFSFCVVLWEALFGERPFSAAHIDELAAAIEAGVPALPRGRLERRAEAALIRGLAADPDDRFEHLADLLEVLEHRRPANPLRWATAVVASVSLLAAGGLVAANALDDGEQPCEHAADELAELWGDAQRSAIAQSFAATGSPVAAASAAWVVDRIDEHAARWTASHTAACTATLIDQLQTTESMELRLGCLRRAKNRLSVVLETLAHADRRTVEEIDSLVAELPALERCEDVERLRADAPLSPAPEVAESVELIRAKLTRAELLRTQGRLAEAHDAAVAARAEARALGFEPLSVAAALVEGEALLALDRLAPAETALREAFTEATRLRMTDEEVKALDGLVMAIRLRREYGRNGEAEWLSQVALAIAAREDPGGRLEAEALQARAIWVDSAGRSGEAVELQRRALDILFASSATDELMIARYCGRLSGMLMRNGESIPAEAEARRAIEIHERLGSPEHSTLVPKISLIYLLSAAGRLDEAEVVARSVLRISSESYGPAHIQVAHAQVQLAAVLNRRGDFEGARRGYASAIATFDAVGAVPDYEAYVGLARISKEEGDFDAAWEAVVKAREVALRVFGAEHPRFADVTHLLGDLALLRGDGALADRYHGESLALAERVHGPDHFETALFRISLVGRRLGSWGPSAALEAESRAALEILQRGWPPDHEFLMVPLHNHAELLRARGGLDEARDLLERLWSVQSDEHPSERAEAAFALAEVLWELSERRESERGRRERARYLAQTAVELFDSDGTADSRRRAAFVRGWLGAHAID